MLKVDGKVYGNFKSSVQNKPKMDCLSLFLSQNTIELSVRSNVPMLFYVLNACMAWLNRSCVIVLPNQFSIRCIVEVDFSITTFVAGDTRYNLNSILISEKKTFSTPEHCFMYLVIPGRVFSSDAINFDAIQHRFHTDWHHLKK